MKEISLEKDDLMVALAIIIVLLIAYAFFKLFYSVPR